jgi:hypothetical protein
MLSTGRWDIDATAGSSDEAMGQPIAGLSDVHPIALVGHGAPALCDCPPAALGETTQEEATCAN